MKKGSFFERLTGAINEEEAKENNSLEELEELEETKPEKVEVTEKKPKTKKSHSKATASIEDSNSEEEGELLVDVYQTSDEIIIKSAIAGVKANDLNIEITNDRVIIKGTRSKDEDVSPEDYYYQELYWGPFSKAIILPVEINPDKAKASLKNGILTIKLPKLEKSKVKTLKIKELE